MRALRLTDVIFELTEECRGAVSRSEAAQQKRLLVLSRHWELEEEIALDIGPRHFLVSTQEGSAFVPPADVRAGDRCACLGHDPIASDGCIDEMLSSWLSFQSTTQLMACL